MSSTLASFADLTAAARQNLVPSERVALIDSQHPTPDPTHKPTEVPPRFELYHTPFSICSHKVRITLAECHLTYASYQTQIMGPAFENYHPDYVRLRLASSVAKTASLATSFGGDSSVKHVGFDGLVVPTLIDNDRQQIVADSLAISLYLCEQAQDQVDLIPADLETEVRAKVDQVDLFPHVALVYGANPDGDHRPEIFKQGMPGVHAKKIAAVRQRWEPVRGQDEALDAAYSAKIAKEEAASQYVEQPDQMRAAVRRTDELVGSLAESLKASTGPWLFGDRFTLADAFWVISLYRLTFLGYAFLWRDRPERQHIEDYATRGYQRPAMRTAVCQWPDQPVTASVAQWALPETT